MHDAVSELPPANWQPGDRLTLRSREWTVLQRTAYANCEALRLASLTRSGSRTFLAPFDRPRRVAADGRLGIVSSRAWLHAFERLLLDGSPYGGLRHWPSTLHLLPCQLEPALATLRDGHPRLLIADDVGLGKTIEAGLILCELAERHADFRALVLVPAGLRQQWQDELATKFGVRPVIADADWLRTVARDLPVDVNPWSPPAVYLASFDFVKRPEALRPLEEVRWDVLVVDEAHAASVASDRRAAIDAIAVRSRRVVLLTATPPADPAQFEALCRIGAAPGHTDIVLFQRARTGDDRLARRSVLLSVRLTEEERRLHRVLERYTTLVWREARRSGSAHARLLTVILRKRALSSIASLQVSLERRRDFLAGVCVPLARQLILPLAADDDDDARDDSVDDEVLASPGLSDSAGEQRWLKATLAAAAAAAAQDSKWRVLRRLLIRLRQPAIVFTEYRDTLESLRLRLRESGHAACAVHGGMSREERGRTLQDFARGGKILLATDAAAEGLNLQHACRVVVHYELPWNPARMLQRAGRVDRMGQVRRVHEVALVASDTAESLVLAPLARRAGGWRATHGPARMLALLTESRVAEAVFEGALPQLPAAPIGQAHCSSVSLIDEAMLEAARLERRRTLVRLARFTRAAPTRGVPVSTLHASSLGPGVVLLFEVRTSAGDHSMLERGTVALHVQLALPAWPRKPSSLKQCIRGLLSDLLAAASPVLEEVQKRQRDGVRSRYLDAAVRMHRRDVAVGKVHGSAARHLVQASLFERSSVRRAPLPNDALEALDAADLDCGPDTELLSSVHLRAVLMVPPR